MPIDHSRRTCASVISVKKKDTDFGLPVSCWQDRAMAASTGVLGWTRDSLWPLSSSYASHYRGNHLLCSSQAVAPSYTAMIRYETAAAEHSSSSGNGDGGDYALRSHELIASPTSTYEVLETLGEKTPSFSTCITSARVVQATRRASGRGLCVCVVCGVSVFAFLYQFGAHQKPYF